MTVNERRPRVFRDRGVWMWRCHHGYIVGGNYRTWQRAIAGALAHFRVKHVTPSDGG